jgi:hypothetical protein
MSRIMRVRSSLMSHLRLENWDRGDCEPRLRAQSETESAKTTTHALERAREDDDERDGPYRVSGLVQRRGERHAKRGRSTAKFDPLPPTLDSFMSGSGKGCCDLLGWVPDDPQHPACSVGKEHRFAVDFERASPLDGEALRCLGDRERQPGLRCRQREGARLSSASSIQASPAVVEKKTSGGSETIRASSAIARATMYSASPVIETSSHRTSRVWSRPVRRFTTCSRGSEGRTIASSRARSAAAPMRGWPSSHSP